ncbi:MAG: hypothetical protein ABI675_01720 [Chitinophagaceae bacterium]
MKIANTRSFLAILLILFIGCKKGTDNGTPADTFKLAIDEGPVSSSLGKRVNLTGAFGYTWGKNSTELITASGLKMYRLDLANKQYQEIAASQLLVAGKNHDNSALIMAGNINGQLAYFEYNFDSKQMSQILSFEENDASILSKSGNDIFYFTQKANPPSHCDGFCWGTYPGANPSAYFYYLDFADRKAVSLKGKFFSAFSKDGKKTLLQAGTRDSFFIFDNSAKKLVDSFRLDIANAGFVDPAMLKIFYDSEPKFISLSINNDITVRNLRTLAQVDKLPTTCFPGDILNFKWSDDGTKIYYTTVKGAACDKIYLGIYDLVTKQEKVIIENLSYQSGGSNPIDYIELSSDNKRILVKYENDFYFKDLN